MLKFIKNLFNSTEKNLLAFEFGIILSDVAQQQKVILTAGLVKKAEEIIRKEFKTKTATEIAGQLEMLTLAVFETE